MAQTRKKGALFGVYVDPPATSAKAPQNVSSFKSSKSHKTGFKVFSDDGGSASSSIAPSKATSASTSAPLWRKGLAEKSGNRAGEHQPAGLENGSKIAKGKQPLGLASGKSKFTSTGPVRKQTDAAAENAVWAGADKENVQVAGSRAARISSIHPRQALPAATASVSGKRSTQTVGSAAAAADRSLNGGYGSRTNSDTYEKFVDHPATIFSIRHSSKADDSSDEAFSKPKPTLRKAKKVEALGSGADLARSKGWMGKENIAPPGEERSFVECRDAVSASSSSRNEVSSESYRMPLATAPVSTQLDVGTPSTPRLDGRPFDAFYDGDDDVSATISGGVVGLGLGFETQDELVSQARFGPGFRDDTVDIGDDDSRRALQSGDASHAMPLDAEDDKPLTPLKSRPRIRQESKADWTMTTASGSGLAFNTSGQGHRRQQSSVASLGPWQTAESLARPSRMRLDWSVPVLGAPQSAADGIGLGILGVDTGPAMGTGFGDGMDFEEEFAAVGDSLGAWSDGATVRDGPISVSVSVQRRASLAFSNC